MLWSSQHQNTNQGRVGPNWNVNMSAHDKEPSVFLIPCCTKPLSKVALPTQNSQANSKQDELVGMQYEGYYQ